MVFGLEKFCYPEDEPVKAKPRVNRLKEEAAPAKPKINRRKEEPMDEGRRKFLKFMFGAAAAGVVANPAIKAAEKVIDKFGQLDATNKEAKTELVEEEVEEAEITSEQIEIANHDAKSLEEIVSYRKPGKIDLTLDSSKQVEHYWLNQYAVGTLHRSLETAYRDIGEWQPYLEAEFKKEFDERFAATYGHDEQKKAIEFIFLAIPESHWNVKAVSPAKAVGPYQFMHATAKEVDLHMSAGVDERKDPVKSARAAAKILKQLFVATRDWDLTLSGYNGGFVWKYLKENRGTNQKISYANFLEYLENKINHAKSDIERNPKIRPERKEAEFHKQTAGYAENLNYPAKFNAVQALIKDKLVSEQKPVVRFGEKRISNPVIQHRVKYGETMGVVARRYGLTEEQLRRYNGIKKAKPLKANMNLRIPPRVSLTEVSRQQQVPLARLAHLNPAMEVNTPIPHNYLVRV